MRLGGSGVRLASLVVSALATGYLWHAALDGDPDLEALLDRPAPAETAAAPPSQPGPEPAPAPAPAVGSVVRGEQAPDRLAGPVADEPVPARPTAPRARRDERAPPRSGRPAPRPRAAGEAVLVSSPPRAAAPAPRRARPAPRPAPRQRPRPAPTPKPKPVPKPAPKPKPAPRPAPAPAPGGAAPAAPPPAPAPAPASPTVPAASPPPASPPTLPTRPGHGRGDTNHTHTGPPGASKNLRGDGDVARDDHPSARERPHDG